MSTFETAQQRQTREAREEQERVLNENIQYAAFFDALEEIFGGAQELFLVITKKLRHRPANLIMF